MKYVVFSGMWMVFFILSTLVTLYIMSLLYGDLSRPVTEVYPNATVPSLILVALAFVNLGLIPLCIVKVGLWLRKRRAVRHTNEKTT